MWSRPVRQLSGPTTNKSLSKQVRRMRQKQAHRQLALMPASPPLLCCAKLGVAARIPQVRAQALRPDLRHAPAHAPKVWPLPAHGRARAPHAWRARLSDVAGGSAGGIADDTRMVREVLTTRSGRAAVITPSAGQDRSSRSVLVAPRRRGATALHLKLHSHFHVPNDPQCQRGDDHASPVPATECILVCRERSIVRGDSC